MAMMTSARGKNPPRGDAAADAAVVGSGGNNARGFIHHFEAGFAGGGSRMPVHFAGEHQNPRLGGRGGDPIHPRDAVGAVAKVQISDDPADLRHARAELRGDIAGIGPDSDLRTPVTKDHRQRFS
jgi:hypothetical protein